ncbi:phage portal protein family protein [Bacteroides sp.]
MTNRNKKKVPQTSAKRTDTIVAKIIGEFKDRTRAEIKKWRQALELAGDIEAPRLYLLQDMYDNLKDDGHFISQVELRKAATLCAPFHIQNRKTGEIDEEKTKLFASEWFYNLMEDILEAPYYGYTLLELVNPLTMTFELVPRRNVVPTLSLVLQEVNASTGISYETGYENTLIHVGKPSDYGLMANICGQLIWKRNAQQSWAEFSERFGFPLITATTNKTSQGDIDKIDNMLSALGEAAQAVLPEGTTIDIKPFSGGDAYQVYDKQIERINTEIGKPITGGTMISDNGSSRSQSEVHERNLDGKIASSDRRIVTFTVNNQLMRIMQAAGWNINPETDEFVFDTTVNLSLKEYFEIVTNLLEKGYPISTKWISKTFNIPIDGEPVTPAREQSVTKAEKKPGGFLANFQ